MKRIGNPLPALNCHNCGWFWRLWGVCGNPDSKLVGEYVGQCDTCGKWSGKDLISANSNFVKMESVEECKKLM